MSDVIEIRAADGTSARIARNGAEPVSWQVAGREYLWSGDPVHWNRHAPWLFPVVGASSGGMVRVEGRAWFSSVRQPIRPAGQHCVRILVSLLEGRPLADGQILLKPDLVVRGSSSERRG